MSDLDELIRTEVEELVRRVPPPVGVERIRQRLDDGTAGRLGSWTGLARQPRLVFVVCLALVGAVAWFGTDRVVRSDRSGSVMSAEEIDRATIRPADEPLFREEVTWPHHLSTSTPGWQLLLTEEIRPGGYEPTTNQTFTSGGGLIHLEIWPSSGPTQVEESFEVLDGRPFIRTSAPGDGLTANWDWGSADVSIISTGFTEGEAVELLTGLRPRAGDPLSGFDPGETGLELIGERLRADGELSPAVVRAWYGTETETDGRSVIETTLEVQAVAPDGRQPDLRTVSIHGIGGTIADIGGREVLVGHDQPWTTAAWYTDDGVLLTVQVKGLATDDLDGLTTVIDGIRAVDQGTWDEAVAGLSAALSTRPITAEATIGGVRLAAHQAAVDPNGMPFSHICVTPVGGVETCRANPLLRDGGPAVKAPFGTLSWTEIELGTTTVDTVIGGTWWVAAFDELGSGDHGREGVTIDTGDESYRLARSDDGRFLVAAVPSSAATADVVDTRWRPSSASHEPAG